MRKKSYSLLILGLFCAFFVIITSCSKGNSTVIDAFNNGTSDRNMIVVISDLHLGADIAYAEINKNLKPLEHLLTQIRVSTNVKELVIAGDMFDEWFVPGDVDTYKGKDQRDFMQRIAITNKGVIDAFNSIIKEKKIVVTYVPGNHDLTITKDNVEFILPGINQARDNVLGLGTYMPEDFPALAIEHGHRYNFFCAPDPISNQDVAPGTIMPPGYFFTRIATTHVVQKTESGKGVVIPITPYASGGESQVNLFKYWGAWKWSLELFTLNNKFDEKIILTNVDGFKGTYSVNDLLPYQSTPGGLIKVNLYNGIQDTWMERQARNLVSVSIPAARAIDNANNNLETDNHANLQYFSNPKSHNRIVVFGHSHWARIDAYDNFQGQKSIYANSGTWIDHNPRGKSTTFLVITPQGKKETSYTFVKLYNFENEIITEMATDSLHL